MPRTAIAPTFVGEGKIELREHTYRDPGPGELLLAVGANAICGTDREQWFEGSAVVPGHEAAGTVVAAGEGTTVAEGTRGAVFLMDYCGTCHSCRLGYTNQCLAKRNDMGFTADGGYGPYEIVHESNFFAVPDSVTAAEATLLLDVMGTSGHALGRIHRMREDVESLYVAGAGPIGLGILVMARIRYGTDVPVYVSDVSPWRLAFAEELGATPVDATRPVTLTGVDAAIDSGLAGTYWPVWISHTVYSLPLAIFLLHNFMRGLPKELIEAARVDGAGHVQIFLRVLAPLLVPAVAAFSIFQFLWVWNDLLVALTFANTPGTNPMTVALANLAGSRGSAWYLLSAAAFVSMLLPLIVFLSMQRFFVRGLLAGSVKG
ncbi:ABC transporter permease subunit [Dactylosporangium cerinum]|uniref:ABC transporter permease subunit n=1 Tax=Dactylosporangium cerinum TaxID=1434730 RepID=A0ABV9VKL2_9ACTN